jgi:G patch domain-containing protein 1
MKMFGKLTRTTKLFYPSRLVCKRFNVKNPHPDQQGDDASSRRTQAGGKQPLSKESVKSIMNNNTLDDFTNAADIANDPLMQAVIPKPSERAQQEAPAVQNTESANAVVNTTNTSQEGKDEAPLDYERPSMDIFKAIFEDSDEEEDEEEGLGEIEPTSMAVDQRRDLNVTRPKSDEDDDMIGPPLPPPEEEAKPVFRPMFKKRSQDRQKDDSDSSKPIHAGPMSFISSEEHIVEPFNPSSSERKSREHKRSRHNDSDQNENSDERKRSSSRSRHHKKDSKKKKRKSDRERSRSREGRHKKSKQRRREPSNDEIDPDKIAERLVYDDSLWVEKPSAAKPIGESHSSRARPKAYDMW